MLKAVQAIVYVSSHPVYVYLAIEQQVSQKILLAPDTFYASNATGI